MFRIALKTALSHKVRLIMTAMSIVVGVAFISGTFVFTDTINRTFTDLFENAFAGQDVIVQSVTEVDAGYAGPPPLDEAVLDVVLGVDGVEVAEGFVGGFALVIGSDGEAIVPMGPPTLGSSWAMDDRLDGSVSIRDGRPPETPGEVVIDAQTVETGDLSLGSLVSIQTVDGVDDFRLVGIAGFGEVDNFAGATWVAFEMATAQELLGFEGLYSNIVVVAEEGVGPEELSARIAAVMPSGIEAVTAESEMERQTATMEEGLSFIQTGLLVFAIVAVLVAAFIIQNTFRIIVRQRQRELALFRAVGASGAQVISMVVIEAALVAVIASVLGILGGLGVSKLLVTGMAAIGWDMPEVTAPLTTRTILIGMTVGVGVTLIASILPAIRASRIPPVAALRDMDVRLRMSDRSRAIIGSILMVLGISSIVLALFSDVDLGPVSDLMAVGAGALGVFMAVSLLSSRIVKPLARIIGWPMPRFDELTGTLATENAIRKPRRTATTASALMIGLALVALFFVFGASIKASAGAAIEEGLRADYVLSVDGFVGGFSPELAAELDALDEVAVASRLRMGFWDNDGTEDMVMAVDPATIEQTVGLDVQAGAVADLGANGVFVHETVADDRGYAVGDTVTMGFAATGIKEVPIVGIYGAQGVVQTSYLVGLDFYERNFAGWGTDVDFVVAVVTDPAVDPDHARDAIGAVASRYANASLRDQAEYRQAQEQQVDQLLVMFNGLLFLSVIIAMFGITNTLALSVYERTREIGLLRAVGMTTWQVRRMVLWESIIVAVIGALLGIAVGLFLGVVVTSALAGQGITHLAVPIGSIAALVVFGALVGLIASVVPARKAARLDILEAIAFE